MEPSAWIFALSTLHIWKYLYFLYATNSDTILILYAAYYAIAQSGITNLSNVLFGVPENAGHIKHTDSKSSVWQVVNNKAEGQGQYTPLITCHYNNANSFTIHYPKYAAPSTKCT